MHFLETDILMTRDTARIQLLIAKAMYKYEETGLLVVGATDCVARFRIF